jgi:hypothetical protein
MVYRRLPFKREIEADLAAARETARRLALWEQVTAWRRLYSVDGDAAAADLRTLAQALSYDATLELLSDCLTGRVQSWRCPPPGELSGVGF